MQLETSTGDIDVNLSRVIFSDATSEITSSTGQIKAYLADLEYKPAQTRWEISSSTGKVDCTIDQTIEDQGVLEFDIDVASQALSRGTILGRNCKKDTHLSTVIYRYFLLLLFLAQ